MSNLEAAQALIDAINFDRFPEIEARHSPDVTFWSFRGPTLHDSVAVMDWHREFLVRYADCTYTDNEFLEQDDIVVVRTTIDAKGYDWREFHQRALEVLRFTESGEVAERRLYAMLRDIELPKAINTALEKAIEYKGGSAAETRKLAEGFTQALVSGDQETAKSFLDEKAVLIDSVYGIVSGPDQIIDLMASIPRPAFGALRVTNTYAGEHDAAVEVAIDPHRPRAADWFRIVEDKILVIETYWMLREVGLNPYVEYSRDRHQRKVIMPI